ncbi:NAD(P)H-dependent flavin oxidoreductase [Paraburkholderia sp. NMBU_R16]|uniref:NAD(P)H-dependent flavin oxidoreductase n=1 Tax=Paraburkholderia sp. NMBU_R16 TaxID=2698676 RepID=UPI00349F62E2
MPPVLRDLSVPVIASPLFRISYPELVLAQCKAGIVGSFPALNARPSEQLNEWLVDMKRSLAEHRASSPNAVIGPLAVNHIVHPSNPRMDRDIDICLEHRVPIFITSLQAPPQRLVREAHSYGGIVLHDVTTIRHALKALDAGTDGLILVCAGSGGHAGTVSPFALVGEVRRFFAGPLALAGAITNGAAVLAAQAMGADFAYIGTRFISTIEANSSDAYRDAIVQAGSADIVNTDLFTGIRANYLRQSIVAAGLDPDALPKFGDTTLNFAFEAKPWRDIWGAGQGVGVIDDVPSVADLVSRWRADYADAKRALRA